MIYTCLFLMQVERKVYKNIIFLQHNDSVAILSAIKMLEELKR